MVTNKSVQRRQKPYYFFEALTSFPLQVVKHRLANQNTGFTDYSQG